MREEEKKKEKGEQEPKAKFRLNVAQDRWNRSVPVQL